MDPALRQIFAEEAIPLGAEVEARLLEIERRAVALADEWRALLGALHTLKGNFGMVGLDGGEALAHAMEQRAREVRAGSAEAQAGGVDALLVDADRLRALIVDAPGALDGTGAARRDRAGDLVDRAPDGEADAPAPAVTPAASPTVDDAGPIAHVRITTARLDRLLDTTVDLGARHERLRLAVRGLAGRRGDRDAQACVTSTEEITRHLAELRAQVMAMRMVPLSTVLARFDRLVRDLSRATGKAVALEVHGGEIAVDKQVADQLGAPLLHLVRNAIDHGIEAPRARALSGKPERGTLVITARATGGMLHLDLRDDGRGIDTAGLAVAAARRGVDTTGWDDARLRELVFAPELSTASALTTLSGRGVGLDQARRDLERLGGALEVEAVPPPGAGFQLRVPLVIAVQRALLVRCGDEIFGVPFTAVIEAFRLPSTPGARVVPWRGRELSTCALAEELGVDAAPSTRPATCIVVDRSAAPVGVIVDDVVGHQDLTSRELDPVFASPRGITGAALLADGRIVPLLDLHAIGRAAPALAGGAA